ncbi:hypothetical protein M427DRAFT_47254 [Gonapodya prolifera JEL478]|uniref:SH3 domain-containing protein n=1 Tax=Gonapodya prolifera (strain JEL478) TaxID=1344416 RepID=A0A139A3K9_GONPJ|nr:hypothetical protein M427DRAFT_47254 [Gonapodya prolifera JEL478]|eukprot:KXS11249.1 hypothetical protein M427DRAFT_47254 [Gonapodya prolifera JEL478]
MTASGTAISSPGSNQAQNDDAGGSGLATGAIVGIVVGIAAIVLAAVGGALYWRRRKARSGDDSVTPFSSEKPLPVPPASQIFQQYAQSPVPTHGSGSPYQGGSPSPLLYAAVPGVPYNQESTQMNPPASFVSEYRPQNVPPPSAATYLTVAPDSLAVPVSPGSERTSSRVLGSAILEGQSTRTDGGKKPGVYTAGTQLRSNYDAVESDELTVRWGDSIQVMQFFDDGWALGVNLATNKQGVLPQDLLRM